MLDCMKHKSSYTWATYDVPEMGVYGGGLAHENSFAAAQLLANKGRDIVVILSGECFVDRGKWAVSRQ
jgi:asparagine synthase (glutamine-hydrolysing)